MSRLPIPQKAVILAAGFGTRMHPLTLQTPKPLLPVWGKPILAHVLELLRRWGVRNVLVNLHHGADPLLRYLSHTPPLGLRINLSFEPHILGTGGALRRAAWFLDEHPFWLVNADVLADVPARPFVQAYRRDNPLAVLWLHPSLGPRTVEVRRNRITCFRSARPGTNGTCTFCGLQLLSPELLRYLPPTAAPTLVEAYEGALRDNKEIMGITVPESFWADIGTPQSYRAAHADIARRHRRGTPGKALFDPQYHRSPATLARQGVQAQGLIVAARGLKFMRGAKVRDAVIWDGAIIGPHAEVRDAIVGTGARLNGYAEYMALCAEQTPDPDVQDAIRRLGWTPAATVVMPFPPRGSARSFTRLQAGRRSVILIRYSTQRAENALYATHARFLRHIGFRVPRVLLDLPARSLTVIEDAGHTALQQLVPRLGAARALRLYERVLDNVLILHARGKPGAARRRLPLSTPFGERLYRWEHNLFCEEFLEKHRHVDPLRAAAIRQELSGLIPVLKRATPVLVHRDLQSSNVLIRHGAPVFIDFQGMRFGPAAYDLASLLCDPYVELPPAMIERLLAYYAAHSPDGQSVQRLFWTAAVERLVQALGAYGRLGATPATAYFLQYVPAALRAIRVALSNIDGLPELRETLGEFNNEQQRRV